METTTVPNPRPPATPEEIWAILRESAEVRKETDRLMRETELQMRENAEVQKKTDLQMQETDRRMQETDRLIKELRESQKKTERQMSKTDIKIKKLSENVGGLNRSIGELIEILIAAHLWEKFPEYDLHRAYRRIPIYNEKNEAKTDIDILLVNTEWAMVIEVKSEFEKEKEIDRHIKRMGLILQYPPKLIEPQVKVLGGIAAGMVTPEAAMYAHQCGFFVLELKGESVVRIPAPPGFKPKEWPGT